MSSFEIQPSAYRGESSPMEKDNHASASFWGDAHALHSISTAIQAPAKPLEILEQLGPSPFERGGFPLIGFLATTYDKVSQFALERVASVQIQEIKPRADIVHESGGD